MISENVKEKILNFAPERVAHYLQFQGWTILQKQRGGVLYEKNKNEVFLPDDSSYADYRKMLFRLFFELSDFEEKDIDIITEEIYRDEFDVIKIRTYTNSNVNPTALPVADAEKTLNGTREMLSAAAIAVNNKRSHYYTKSHEVVDFLKHVEIGQMEKDSLILSVYSPVFQRKKGISFGRQAVNILADSLTIIQDAIKTENAETLFAGVKNGVSANIIYGLINLCGLEGTRAAEIEINWALKYNFPYSKATVYTIKPENLPFLRNVALALSRADEDEGRVRITGHILKLKREQETSYGVVTLLVLFGGRNSKVDVKLKPRDYTVALEAHKSERTFRINGTLKTMGEGFQIINYTHVSICDDVMS